MVEFLESRTLLSQGLMITAITPTKVENATFDHVDVTFNKPIDPTSFGVNDVTLTGPPDVGNVTVSSITELDSTDYRIAFPALTERGTYHITIGPDITDTSGIEMDQNQNGTPGEIPGDQFSASLDDVQATTIFTINTVIHEGDTTYDGQDIAVDGATVTIDGPHSFNSVQLVNGAVLTHSANTTTQTHELNLTVNHQVIVDATSAIDVTGKGYQAGYTAGNTKVGGATSSSGGSYGGLGGAGSNGPQGTGVPNEVYGDYSDPDEPGAGSGLSYGVAGGGLVRLQANTLQLDGSILADGLASTGGGSAGGGIWLDVGTLVGSGMIRAGGGLGQRYDCWP
jgi:hypothetical protein